MQGPQYLRTVKLPSIPISCSYSPTTECPRNSMWAESQKIPDFLLDLRWFMALQLPTLGYCWLSGLSQLQTCFTASPWYSVLRKLWNAWMRLFLRKECRIQHTVIPFHSISWSGYQQLLQRFNLVHWAENTLGKRTLQLPQSAGKGCDLNQFQQSRS